MTAATAAAETAGGPPPRLRRSAEARAVSSADGVVLMDVRRGRYLTLNPTGAIVWQGIEAEEDFDSLLARLTERFSAPPAELRHDLGRLLARLADAGLVEPADDAPAGVTTSTAPAPESQPCQPAEARTAKPPGAAERRLGMVVAYGGLVLADLLLKVLGYRRFHRFVRGFRVRAASHRADVGALCAIVDAASRFYLKRAWCLQRSAVTACLLRWKGIPAELVIGVREVPFLAHAWVEVGGEVVNDRRTVKRFYREIDRC